MVGRDTMLARLAQIVAEAQRSRAPIQRLADKVAGWFVPVVIGVAVLAFAAWMAFGPERGLAELDRLGADPEVMAVLDQYHLWPAARAELLRRAGRARDAHAWFERAAAMAPTTAERAHLERRLRQTGGG